MKKKALIVYRVDKEDLSNIGVLNKLRGQVEGLKKNEWEVDYICHDRKNIYLNNATVYKRRKSIFYTIFKWKFYSYLVGNDINKYKLYIVRYGVCTPSFICWLKKIRSDSKNAKIIIDMPTFPYENEWKGAYGKLVLFIDKIYSRELYQYVDHILHSGSENRIHKINTLKGSNGINIDVIPRKKRVKQTSIHFVAMAKWREWHGIDRLFVGLRKYIDDGGTPVIVDVLGEGPISRALKQLVEQLDLNEVVFFHGVKYGHELDAFFDNADLGIGTLGMHRKGIAVDSSLKHREYVARGLPFVMSGVDFDIKKGNSFVYHLKADNSPVNVHELIEFLERLKSDELLSEKMRSFAVAKLSWDVKMRDLLKKIFVEKT